MATSDARPLIWLGDSLETVRAWSENVRSDVGFALRFAQRGEKHASAKPLVGFDGGKVVEIVAEDAAGTYRTVYTVQFANAIYVLHAFQKKATQGIATPQRHINLVKSRLAIAREHAANEMRERNPK